MGVEARYLVSLRVCFQLIQPKTESPSPRMREGLSVGYGILTA